MIRDRPLRGFGLGTFTDAYPAYALADYGAVLNHVHNDWLEFAVEGGLPFAALMVFTAGAAVRLAAKHLWALGLSFVFLHACVDFPLAVDGVLVWILILAAAASSECRRPQEDPGRGTTRIVDMDCVGAQWIPQEKVRRPAPLTRRPLIRANDFATYSLKRGNT